MTGDNEHEREGAGDEPTPESAEASAGGSLTPEPAESGAFEEPLTEPGEHVPPAPRPFRSWAAAEEKPSLFARLRKSIGAVFRSKPQEEPPEEETAEVAEWQAESDIAAARYEGEESADDRPWMEPRVVEAESPVEPAATEGAIPWIEPPRPTEPEPIDETRWDALSPVSDPESHAPRPEPEPEPFAEVSGEWEERRDEPVAESSSPWEESQGEPVAEPGREARPSRFGGNFFEAPTEIIPEEKPPKPGFLARLFGRKSKAMIEPVQEPVAEEIIVATNEYELEEQKAEWPSADEQTATADASPDDGVEQVAEPVAESRSEIEAAFEEAERGFASVEEALPAEGPSSADEQHVEPMVAFEAGTEPAHESETPKAGFFSRLVQRLSRKVEAIPERKERPSLEIEIHEDRIAAAADALDQMGEQTLADAQQTPAEPFASVDEALPSVTGHERFAPPAAMTPPDSRPTVEVERDTRPTVEVTKDTRPTIEVAQDARPTMEVSAPAVDLGKTMDAGLDLGKTMDAGIDLGKTMDAGIDLGKTMDVVPFDDTLEVDKSATPTPKAPDIHLMFGNTLEIADERRKDADSGAYFGDTLEPSHFGDIAPPPETIDKDTDEYEIPIATSAETPAAAAPDLDVDTAQVSRKSLLEKLLFWRKQQEAEKPAGDGAVTMVEGNPNFLFSKFRTFYNEIIRHKHQKSEFTAGFSTAIVTDYSADLSPEGAADALSKNLAAMLELQAAEAQWMGGDSARLYADAQYAMAALADETFLHEEWEGKGAWHKHLLEVKLFKSRSADVELFKRIDKLLKEQPNSPAARDLARVYLMVIAAGFKGKYRPFGLTRALADYRQRLYEYIHHGGDALLLYAPDRRIFPEATERTLVGHAIGRFTSAQRWAAILAFLLLSYTAIAHYAWNRVSADLRDVTDRIKATSTTASGNGGP